MAHPESILQRLALPAEFGVALLVFCFTLAIAPYLAGLDFGVLKIPTLQPRERQRVKIFGPICLLFAIILHLPLLAPPSHSSIEVHPATAVPKPYPTKTQPTENVHPPTISSPLSAPEKRESVRHSSAPLSAYRVYLQIPTAMSDATVWADEREARIVERTKYIITIDVSPVPDNHHIRLQNTLGRVCDITQVITQDRTLINPCYP